MAKTWPELGPDQMEAQLQAGLGGTADKEYVIAPYAQIVQAAIPAAIWSGVYFTWISMKGHLQGLHGFLRGNLFATRFEDTVYATFIVVWEELESFAAWLENGYPLTEMLLLSEVPAENMSSVLARDYS